MKTPRYRFAIFHPADLAAEKAECARRLEEIRANTFELLNGTEPDTFLGRQHHPLIPPPAPKKNESEGA